jgi:hypothetical protein
MPAKDDEQWILGHGDSSESFIMRDLNDPSEQPVLDGSSNTGM